MITARNVRRDRSKEWVSPDEAGPEAASLRPGTLPFAALMGQAPGIINSSKIKALVHQPAAGRLPLSIVVLAFLLGMPVLSLAAPAACLVRGEVIQWIADYCMLEAQTDDEIAVSNCIAEHLGTKFADECAAMLHFKRAMCGVPGMGGAPRRSVDACVADPEFMGRIVRHGGVGR